MTPTDGYEGFWEADEIYLDADICVLLYGLPMEVFVHMAASGVVRGWWHEGGALMMECNGLVALLGQPSYSNRQ